MIDKKTIKKIAELSRLEVSDVDAEEYSVQLSKALQFFEHISKVDTHQIEPMITPVEIESFWREDIVNQEYTAEEMIKNAPESLGHLFKVPPVV
ncbi:MAG TPA: Asp-tRNA(Asn)/Glu-tRNA(Gln) amidotransferase subunit GatC [Pseudobdellovibrionaceae bacterium]|nr:Asp-tRNA(Asn)/Glu-tRNA(Gln) amidotransferase subunit GatC [Pseudobdellovibrionaceae bacterium]